jgi:hypothetical protein
VHLALLVVPFPFMLRIMRAISFVYRFVALLAIVAYLEGNRDA